MYIGQILFIVILMQPPKSNINDINENPIWNMVDIFLQKKEINLIFKMYTAKALIVRGDQIGYTFLESLIKNHYCSPGFSFLFSNIITKHISSCYQDKNFGFIYFKLHPQKLFNMVYPVLQSMIYNSCLGQCDPKQDHAQMVSNDVGMIKIPNLNVI
mmetsp:Transcript_23558/g.23215  ORF Transcript_23558/g.23215 Transcript_23558/m.23215 type:complete len:157 (-) Transcript_23558:486-956(-)